MGLSLAVCSGFLRGHAENVRAFQQAAHSLNSFNKPSAPFPPVPHTFSTSVRDDTVHKKASKRLRPMRISTTTAQREVEKENCRRSKNRATVLITRAIRNLEFATKYAGKALQFSRRRTLPSNICALCEKFWRATRATAAAKADGVKREGSVRRVARSDSLTAGRPSAG